MPQMACAPEPSRQTKAPCTPESSWQALAAACAPEFSWQMEVACAPVVSRQAEKAACAPVVPQPL